MSPSSPAPTLGLPALSDCEVNWRLLPLPRKRLSLIQKCKVSFVDRRGVHHSVEVQAATVFEAVCRAFAIFKHSVVVRQQKYRRTAKLPSWKQAVSSLSPYKVTNFLPLWKYSRARPSLHRRKLWHA